MTNQSPPWGSSRAVAEIQAIKTFYKGVEFRSRLEARWACFFDSVNLPWVYEPEGFSYDGKRYLPDFYLPSWSIYIEVKPVESKENKHLCYEFAASSGYAILLLAGQPGGEAPDKLIWLYDLFCHDTTDSSGGVGSHCVYWVADRDGSPALCTYNSHRDRTFYAEGFEKELACIVEENESSLNTAGLEWKFDFARSAKFEHGQQPDFQDYEQKRFAAMGI